MSQPCIIAEANRHGGWSAWLEDCPYESWGGETAVAALMRLLRAHGWPVALVALDHDPEHPNRRVFRLKRGKVCPECGGRGRYVGLRVVETCGTCGGSGTV
jgi:hypothetical protein